MKIATAAYPLDQFSNWSEYEHKISTWVAEAVDQGADLLVFPEYGAMELASLEEDPKNRTGDAALHAVSKRMRQSDDLHARLSRQHGVHILGASAPVFDAQDRPVNRASFFSPTGQRGYQDKQIMTMVERADMDVQSGGALMVFETDLGRIGVLICYDVEFPLLARGLVEAGVDILLTPSYTENLAGYWRVRIGAMARALEGQCIVVHSPAVGTASWCPPATQITGAAAVYGPPDLGFPDTGVLAEGEMNKPGWVFAEFPQSAVGKVRSMGRVRNFAHWDEQSQRFKKIKVQQFTQTELENS